MYVNGKRDAASGKTFTKAEIDKGGSHLLGFPKFDHLGSPNASDLLADAVKEPLEKLKAAAKISEEEFQAEFRRLMNEYDNISFRQYLVAGERMGEQNLQEYLGNLFCRLLCVTIRVVGSLVCAQQRSTLVFDSIWFSLTDDTFRPDRTHEPALKKFTVTKNHCKSTV